MSNLNDKMAKERMKEIKLQAKLDAIARKDLFNSAILGEPLTPPQDIPAEEKIRRLGNVRGILRNMLFDLLKSSVDTETIINKLNNSDELAMYLVFPAIRRELENVRIITPQMLYGVFESKKAQAKQNGLLTYVSGTLVAPPERTDSKGTSYLDMLPSHLLPERPIQGPEDNPIFNETVISPENYVAPADSSFYPAMSLERSNIRLPNLEDEEAESFGPTEVADKSFYPDLMREKERQQVKDEQIQEAYYQQLRLLKNSINTNIRVLPPTPDERTAVIEALARDNRRTDRPSQQKSDEMEAKRREQEEYQKYIQKLSDAREWLYGDAPSSQYVKEAIYQGESIDNQMQEANEDVKGTISESQGTILYLQQLNSKLKNESNNPTAERMVYNPTKQEISDYQTLIRQAFATLNAKKKILSSEAFNQANREIVSLQTEGLQLGNLELINKVINDLENIEGKEPSLEPIPEGQPITTKKIKKTKTPSSIFESAITQFLKNENLPTLKVDNKSTHYKIVDTGETTMSKTGDELMVATLYFKPTFGKEYQKQFKYRVGNEDDKFNEALLAFRKKQDEWAGKIKEPSRQGKVAQARQVIEEQLAKSGKPPKVPRPTPTATNPNTPGQFSGQQTPFVSPSDLGKGIKRGGKGVGRPRGKNPAKGKKMTARKVKRDRYEELPSGNVMYGKGVCKKSNLKREDKIEYVEFGSKILSIRQLEDEDCPILNLKYPRKANIPFFAKREITKELAVVIQNLIDTGSVNNRLYNGLSAGDKNLFNNLLKVADLHSYIKDDSREVAKALKNRFNVLVGQIEAGNNNPEVAKEARQLIYQLTYSGMIQRVKSIEMLEELDKVLMG